MSETCKTLVEKSDKVSLIMKRLYESVKLPRSERRTNLANSFGLTDSFLKKNH